MCLSKMPSLSSDNEDDDQGNVQRSSRRKAADSKEKEGRASGRLKGKSTAAKTDKVQLTGFALVRKTVYKKLFAWLDPKFKRNGKKLIPDSNVVWKFMVSCYIEMCLLFSH